MQVLRQDTAAGAGIGGIAVVESAQLVGLKKLQPGDVVNFPRRANGFVSGAGDLQIERLQMVGVIARGHVAADNKGQFMRGQVALEIAHVDPGGGEGRQFRIGHWHCIGDWARPGADFDRVQFPQDIGLSNKLIRTPITGLVGKSRSQE